MHKKLILALLILVANSSTLVFAGSDLLRVAIDTCTSTNSTDFSLIASCVSSEYKGSRNSAEADFFIFMDEIDEEYVAKKLTLAKAKASLVRAWQDLQNKEQTNSAAKDLRKNQEEQNRIAEDQKRQFEVMREQNYKACVRRNCVSFVDECFNSRKHCVP